MRVDTVLKTKDGHVRVESIEEGARPEAKRSNGASPRSRCGPQSRKWVDVHWGSAEKHGGATLNASSGNCSRALSQELEDVQTIKARVLTD